MQPPPLSPPLPSGVALTRRRGHDSWWRDAASLDYRVPPPHHPGYEEGGPAAVEKQHRMVPQPTLRDPLVSRGGQSSSAALPRSTSRRPPSGAIYVTPAAPQRSVGPLDVTPRPPLWAAGQPLSEHQRRPADERHMEWTAAALPRRV